MVAEQKRSTGRKLTLIVILLVFLAGIVFAGLFKIGLAKTNEMEFRTSCHTMKVNLEEYKETIHYKNPSGVQATCSDCHVPKGFLPKMVAKVMAAKDVYHEILGTIDTPAARKEIQRGREYRNASPLVARPSEGKPSRCS